MAVFDIFVDVVSGQPVGGLGNTTISPMPPFVQGDTPTFRIWLLNRTSTFPNNPPYVAIPTAGLNLQVALGTRVGASSTYYTQQMTWTPDAGGQPFWTATFPMNTTDVTNLLGAGSENTAWFEIKYTNGGLPTTVMDQLVKVEAAVIKPGSLISVPPGQTALSAEEANAAFLKRTIVGPITLVNPNTGKTAILYIDDDGKFQCDPVN